MGEPLRLPEKLPEEQQAIRAKCFHPSGSFVEFRKEEVEQSVPSRFEQMVRKYPDRLAIKTPCHTLTYEALNQEANRMAHAILALRSKDEKPIALLLEHDAPLITAILAVLKTGKIYVPLDPSYPLARITSMLEDAQPGLIVTNTKHIAFAQALAQQVCHVLDIDELDAHLDSENLGLSLSPDTLAYILYTSGSTGQPKGVTQNHRNVLHAIRSYTNNIHVSPEDRLTLLHSCSTGSSLYHLFGSLLNGAALFPFDSKGEGVAPVIRWLLQEEISVFHSVPAFFHNFVSTLTGAEDFPKLRLIHLSAAPASKKDVELYRKYLSPHSICVHTMGSTEATLIRWYFFDKKTEIPGNHLPVGYSVDDKEIILLDDNGGGVGFGQVGEITIKSRYLSPGYWRKPQLTGAKFLPEPKGGDQKIYLTGDLGRMAPDGCLFHLGREDFQVKVRGYRVEVSEIEMALLEYAAIREAAVVGREIQSGDTRLVAYIVPTKRPGPSVSELRRFLKERLPDYMIPSAFVMLPALPLTPNGKVDRLALPAPEDTRPELDTPFAAPRTPIEEELAGIWAEVLSLDAVGIHDNFFDLGGHSLAATRVVSQVIKQFQLELPLQSLFQSPTVAEMAVVITENQAKKLDEMDLHRILAELESLSDDDAKMLVGKEPHSTGVKKDG